MLSEINRVQSMAEQFRCAIEAAWMSSSYEIAADGQRCRFSANGKRRDAVGQYVLHPDAVPTSAFGDWRSGLTQHWASDRDDAMAEAERQAHRQWLQATASPPEVEQISRRPQESASDSEDAAILGIALGSILGASAVGKNHGRHTV